MRRSTRNFNNPPGHFRHLNFSTLDRSNALPRIVRFVCHTLTKGPIVNYVPGGGGAVVLEGVYNFKTSPFMGGKFFTGKKNEGGHIL